MGNPFQGGKRKAEGGRRKAEPDSHFDLRLLPSAFRPPLKAPRTPPHRESAGGGCDSKSRNLRKGHSGTVICNRAECHRPLSTTGSINSLDPGFPQSFHRTFRWSLRTAIPQPRREARGIESCRFPAATIYEVGTSRRKHEHVSEDDNQSEIIVADAASVRCFADAGSVRHDFFTSSQNSSGGFPEGGFLFPESGTKL